MEVPITGGATRVPGVLGLRDRMLKKCEVKEIVLNGNQTEQLDIIAQRGAGPLHAEGCTPAGRSTVLSKILCHAQ